MSQRGLRDSVSMSDCKLYTYPICLNSSDYSPDKGYPIHTTAKYENRFVELFSQAVPLVFNLMNNLFITYLSMMHHSHLRPANYSHVLMEMRIRQDERQRRYYRNDVIKPRRGKIYYPRGNIRHGHQDEPKGNTANAWLVTFQSPEEIERNGGQFDRDQAMICFSENDAIQLNKNARQFALKRGAGVFFDVAFNKSRQGEMYSAHSVDSVYNSKLKQLAELKREITSKLKADAEASKNKKNVLKRAWEYLVPRQVRAWSDLDFQSNLRKYVLVEASNPKRDTVFFKKAVAYQSLNAELYQRYKDNKETAPLIEQLKIKLDESKAILNDKPNHYLQSHLAKYVADKFELIDAEGLDANIPAVTLLKMKGAVIRDLRKIDYSKVYRELPKKAGLFDVDFSHFNDVIDHQLARGDIPAYVDQIRLAHHK